MPNSGDMIERVALSLCEAHDNHLAGGSGSAVLAYKAGSLAVDYWNGQARAAIAALSSLPQEDDRDVLRLAEQALTLYRMEAPLECQTPLTERALRKVRAALSSGISEQGEK